MKINGLISESIDYVNPIAITDNANLDFNKHYVVTVTSADKTLTLPAVVNNGGKLISIQIDSSTNKLITIDGNSTELIDGLQTRIMWAGETCTLLCNGTSWNKIAGKSIPMIAGIHMGANMSSLSTGQWIKILFDASLVLNAPSAMQDVANNRLKILRTNLYNVDASALPGGSGSSNTQFLQLGVGGSVGTSLRCQFGNTGGYPFCMFMNGTYSGTAGDLITLHFECTAGTPNLIGDTTNGAYCNQLILTEVISW